MYYRNYFKLKKNNQEIFNKKLNWYFDIKSINYKKMSKNMETKFAKNLISNYDKLKNNKKVKKKIIKSKKINYLKINPKKIQRSRLLKIIAQAKKLNLNEYFRHFIFQGSVASLDCVKGWSDIDIFAVTNDKIFTNKKYLIELRKKLKIFYREILKFCKFQHHGLILYTEKDLKNYLNGFLPHEALIQNFSIFDDDKVTFYKDNKKNNKNISKKIIIQRTNFLKETLKIKKYNHHVISKKIPTLPFEESKPHMFELFYQMTTTLNIPILYLDALGKSSHKKNSFQKFYKLIRNRKVISFLKKHEKIRKNWKNYESKNFLINKKLIKILGNSYIEDTLNIYKYLNKKLKIPNKSV
tara:strand:+ start:2989 stop:4050 length:1062 start_codon:yes stop_codon:yes gene_type:complete